MSPSKITFLLLLILLSRDFNADLKWGTHISTAKLVNPDTIKEDEDWIEESVPAGNGQTNNNDDDLPF